MLRTSEINKALKNSLSQIHEYLVFSQNVDGTWGGRIENDPMPTAFFLTTYSNLGLERNEETRQMELYLASVQDNLGAWASSPEGVPNIDVSIVCMLALNNAETRQGQE